MDARIERIKALIKYFGLNTTTFAKKIGFNQSNLSKILRGERDVPANLTDKILDNFKVERTWLLTGEGEMLSSDVTPMEPATIEDYTTTKSGLRYYKRGDGKLLMEIPVVPIEALGSPDDEWQEIVRDEDGEKVTIEVNEVHHGNYVAFRVNGDSMDNGMRSSFGRGDIVCVRELSRDKWLPKLHYKQWPYWVVCFGNNIRLKQIIAHDGPTITLHSLNPSPEYTDFQLNLDDISRLFNVVKHIPHPNDF